MLPPIAKVLSDRKTEALVISVGMLSGTFSIVCPGMRVHRSIDLAGVCVVAGVRFVHHS